MITRVRLENWKSHLNTELSFSNGVNCLIGDMGSGKTSVMQGISFALFGTFQGLQSRKVNIADLLMKKPRKQGKATLEVDFVVGKEKYSVKRMITEKGTVDAEIRKNGVLLDVSAKRVTEEVEKALQMDYELFSRAVYSEQDGLDYFLRIPKGQRMEHIDRMLRVDKFGKAMDNCVSAINKLKHGMDEKIRITGDMEKDDVGEKTTGLVKEIQELENNVKILEKEVKIITEKRKLVQEELELHEEKEEKFQRIKNQLEAFTGRLKEIEERIKSKKEFLKKLDEKQINFDIDKMKKEEDALEREIEEKRKRNHDLHARKKMILESSDKLEELNGKCPLCDSEISSENKNHLIRERKKELEKIEKEVPNVMDDIENKKKLLSDIVEKSREKKLELDRASSYWKELQESENRIKDVKEQVSKLDQEKSEIKISDIKPLRKGYEELIGNENRISSEIKGIHIRVKDKQELLLELQKRQKLLETYKQEIKSEEEAAKQFNVFSTILKNTQNNLREEFLGNVNKIMQNVWDSLYPYEDFSGIRLAVEASRMSKSKDYVLQLKDSTGWISVDGIASGGERSIACLALRIAFSLAFIPNLKWLILDEPTHNLDSSGITSFAEILRENIQRFADQIFLITHEEKLSENITGSLYKFERNKQTDEPTKIVM
ncbi:MAG: AAA family ATPase [Candidatus Aenigmatarchaeota archaeon]